jgi:acetyltransferase
MLATRSGYRFEVRPAHPGDEALLGEFFGHVTQSDLRFRFLSSVQKVSAAQLDEMTHVDHRQKEDFIAFDVDTGRVVANAMLAADKDLNVAEVAISLHEDFKGRGIGWTLLEYVATCAKARGIKKLQSIESRENFTAIELEREMGFVARPLDDDPTLVVLEATLQP